MSGNLIIQGMAVDQFTEDLAQLIKQAVKEEVQAAMKQLKKEELEERFLSIEETCKIFVPAISRQTLHNWTTQGLIKSHAIGRSVFYKYSDIIEAAKPLNRIVNPLFKSAA